MSDYNAIEEALRVLERRRTEATEEVNRLTSAIATLSGLWPPQVIVRPPAEPAPVSVPPTSIKSMMLTVVSERDRDWSTNELLAEFERRAWPIRAKDPNNALRAALVEANNRDKTVFRTETGRYKSTKWRQEDAVETWTESRPDSASGGEG